jgi:serine/threonine protein kinase
MDGGTLYQKLKKGKLSEQETAVVVKQITESIEYLHDLGIAHRDIKPENIVISNVFLHSCRMSTNSAILDGQLCATKEEKLTVEHSITLLLKSCKECSTI